MKYRKEIDGLRSIAVLPVILFHAGVFGFSGGYVGVDIFFVISGYLITAIIVEERERTGGFSLVGFYERRARRILPALSVVLLFTTLTAVMLMPADILKAYSKSLVSVVTFSSNVFFYLTNDYFSTALDEKPLLHTWSLAIEEQYYLFFPLLVSWLWPYGKKKIVLLLSISATISLLLSHYLSVGEGGSAGFYLIFTRAWELFCGSLIALIGVGVIRKISSQHNLLSISGLALILYSIFYFDSNTPFPSFYALVPILGTVMIIVFCDGSTLVGRLLSSKPFVSIGLISYSLYLWHQPLFAFLRLKMTGEPDALMFIAAMAATFLMAFLSYRLVEKPFRNRAVFSNRVIIKFSKISIVVFLVIGVLGGINGFEFRFNNIYAETIQPSPKRKECHTKGRNYLKPEKACRYGGGNITWASFGDSHTVELAFSLSELLKFKGEGLVHLSFSDCAPALLFEAESLGCSDWIKDSVLFLENNKNVKNVLLGFRYSAFLLGDHLDPYPNVPDENPVGKMLGGEGLDKSRARELYWSSFLEIIARLRGSGKNVYIVYPIPELPIHISNAVTPFSIFGGGLMFDLSKMTTVDYYRERNEFILKKLNSLNYSDGLYAIKPFDILCLDRHCPGVDGRNALYFDEDHLSVYGATKLLRGSQIIR